MGHACKWANLTEEAIDFFECAQAAQPRPQNLMFLASLRAQRGEREVCLRHLRALRRTGRAWIASGFPQRWLARDEAFAPFRDDDEFVALFDLTAARWLVKEIKKRTDKPVRQIVYTQWENSHIQGTQAYIEAYPGPLEIIAHETAYGDIKEKAMPKFERNRREEGEHIKRMEEALAKGVGPNGRVMSEEQKAILREQAIPQTKTMWWSIYPKTACSSHPDSFLKGLAVLATESIRRGGRRPCPL